MNLEMRFIRRILRGQCISMRRTPPLIQPIYRQITMSSGRLLECLCRDFGRQWPMWLQSINNFIGQVRSVTGPDCLPGTKHRRFAFQPPFQGHRDRIGNGDQNLAGGIPKTTLSPRSRCVKYGIDSATRPWANSGSPLISTIRYLLTPEE